MPSFYIPELKTGDSFVQVSGDEFHHLIHVFRKQPGDRVLLTNGKGILARGIIGGSARDSVKIILEKLEQFSPSKPEIALAFSLLKGKNDHLIVEKCTELGVKVFFPYISSRTIRKSSSGTVDKFRKTAVSAIKQCDNAYLPEIRQVCRFSDLPDHIEAGGYKPAAALEVKTDQMISGLNLDDGRSRCIIIGPEGGFDESEIKLLRQRADCFSLGNHILRAETAAIAAVSQFLAYNLERDPDYY